MSGVIVPERARVVVIGGGVIGSSIAYHLGQVGERDVVLIERDRLTSGTTWHAAGLMTCFGSFSETTTGIRLYSRDLYARLEAETGLSTGFRPVGLIEAAASEERLEEYRRVATFQRHRGLEVVEISPTEITDKFPHAATEGLLAGFWVPGDGRVNPVDLTMSLAKGARMQGVRIVEGVSAHGIQTVDGRVTGLETSAGFIECEVVVNCAGMWARQLGATHGVTVPNQAAEHYYLLTDTIDGIDPNGPVLEDPAAYGYYREEGGGLMVGLFEPRSAPWQLDGIPADSSFRTLPPDWDRMAPFLQRAMDRVPITHEVGIRQFFCGPESFTPDLMPYVGESPATAGYFVCAGLNSVGVLSAGGLGRVMAHWITTGSPDVDITGFDVRRAQPHQLARSHRSARTTEILGTVYAAQPPGTQLASARGIRRSPIHHELAARGAFFKDVSGWESPDFYDAETLAPQADPSWRRGPWWQHWEAEHRAVREGVGLIDMSFMAKFTVTGGEAGAVVDELSAGAVDGAPGVITYTQWLDDSARLLADLTVTKLDAESFLVVASDTAHGAVDSMLRRASRGRDAQVFDATAAYGQLNVQGPRSREVLALVTSADVSNDAFPFRAARWIDVGMARALAVRITYVGELGWELYVSTEMTAHVHEVLCAAGEPLGMRHVGLHALGSLRMEKAYRDYGHDIDNTDTVIEAGLGFAVAVDKKRPFRGHGAVLALTADGVPARRLVQVRLTDPEPLLFHDEVLYRDGRPVGYLRAASYGWTLGGAVGLALVEADQPVTAAWLAAGTWEVDVAGGRHVAEVSLRPMYDPTNERIRA
ncbi:MAG: FAD-dependent oxidoreductase [Nostocoides sp.]